MDRDHYTNTPPDSGTSWSIGEDEQVEMPVKTVALLSH